MIDFRTSGTESFSCPKCQSTEIEKKSDLFQGIHWLAECKCSKCSTEFWHTYPVAHTRHLTISFSKNGKYSKYPHGSEWLAVPLIESILKLPPTNAEIERKVNKHNKRIVLLNCLDDCYGHVLWKIFNAQYYIQYPEMGIALLIPKGFEWLVPVSVSETWIVDAPLKAFSRQIEGLDAFIKGAFADFKKVYISDLVYTHHHVHLIDFELFLKLKKIPLASLKPQPLRVTFLVREDRFWLNSTALTTTYLASIKFGLTKKLRHLFLRRQMGLILKTANLIEEQQEATFHVIGLGKSLAIDEKLLDLRRESLDTEKELQWCETYQQSHIVIGVHGSHMMIPTALAGGFINLLPEYKTNQIGQDVLSVFPDETGKLLGHYLPESSSPEQVARRVESICRRLHGLDKAFGEMYLD